MSDPDISPTPASQPLQFDRAEFSSSEAAVSELSCTACRRLMAVDYFEVNGQKMCAACKDAAIAARTGSAVGAFVRAWVFGSIAGIAGCGIYYAVLALTGYEVGLIAIVVGLLVGGAVRNGSRHRGGWLYQALAMLITYGSIVTSYVPMIVKEMQAAGANELVAGVPTVILVPFAWITAWFIPFLALPGNLLGIFIVGIGIYEAWKINQRHPFVIYGPFMISGAV